MILSYRLCDILSFMEKRTIKSANIHVFGKCNYRCEHCFDRHLTHRYLAPEEWQPVLNYLKSQGITKINFAGGEPTLYPHLRELIAKVKEMGFTTSIVSNGSGIDEEWMKKYQGLFDWIGLSIDSPEEEDEILIGRHCTGIAHLENVKKVSQLARKNGMKVKLNITVVRKSCMKDFRPIIDAVNPDRVKAFRALTLKNANDDVPDTWSITNEQFEQFRKLHEGYHNLIVEDNSDMIGTYLMFDPLGRWMTNDGGEKKFRPFEELLRDGMESVLDVDRYYGRKAVYEWETGKTANRRGLPMVRAAVFGISRAGKNYTINGAVERLASNGLQYRHVSMIGTVHELLGGKKLRDMNMSEKLELMERVHFKIDMAASEGNIIVDEHYAFPETYGGKKIDSEYVNERLPDIIVSDDDLDREYRVVLDESEIPKYDIVFFLDINPETVLGRFRNSKGDKHNDAITIGDIRCWSVFERYCLKALCESYDVPFVRLTDPQTASEMIADCIMGMYGTDYIARI